ncbi:MAG: M48 family metallopeptidase [Flavobacteriales bacterium]|nr:M48 family metallopeptidase [Flavobacteriales bacterium]MCC6938609.1 M48 family metallopeptidase [Flavobacteriales bacterium]
MRNRVIRGAIVFLAVLLVQACAKVPITGRRQMNLVNEGTLMSMAAGQYTEFLGQNTVLASSDPRSRMVATVGARIAASATKFLEDNRASDRVAGFQWEFNTVDDPTVNAWCMPGGKVVVYTGILPVTQDEAGLAVVLGHEIAHAIARHGNERMSQAIALQGAGMTLEVLVGENPSTAQNLFLQSFGIGSSLGMLAFSRKHESEADKMGLVFMAMAGYDPRTAPVFWERMSQGGGQSPPEILSTHPSDETRIRDLEAFLPEALKYYKP